eukprot:9135358-Pyramimonas_sp.AAC.1
MLKVTPPRRRSATQAGLPASRQIPPPSRPRPSFGALVTAGDPTGSSAATQPQSDVPLAWPRASASARRRGSGLREQRHHVELQRLLHRSVPRLTGL